MSVLIVEVVVILVLLVVSGVFAMTEMAVVSSRKTRLRVMAADGNAGARAALAMAESPNRFLPTVQIGITVVGLLAGTFGGITIAEEIAAVLKPFPALTTYAEAIGVGVVVVALTYLSLVIGELVPKRLALAHPEVIASRMARPVELLTRLTQPLVRLLGASTDLMLRWLGARAGAAEAISNEEVKLLLEEGMKTGVFHQSEPRMVESVLAFDQRPVQDIMTPREKLVFLNQDDPHEAVWHKIVVSGHSHFPVYADSRDRVVGVISVKAIYANLAAGAGVKLADLMMPPLLVPTTQTITGLLEEFKKTRRHIAFVVDESRMVVGLVTLVDVLEAIVGEIPSLEERLRPEAVRRHDGSLLVDGGFSVARLAPLLGESPLAATLLQRCETLAAYATGQLGQSANEGAAFVREGVRIEIIDMDGNRIDKLLVSREKDSP
jgi:putative hemolysin